VELEFETRSRLNKLELQVEEIAASQAQGARRQPAAPSEDPEIPRLMGTWVQEDGISGLDDLARSLAERKPIAPPREEESALEPKPRFDRKSYHAKYMRGWRLRRALRRGDGPA
jgi:hypothetical protein